MNDSNGLTYADSGVNIDAGNALVDRIKPITKSTHQSGVLGGIGGFGGLFELPSGYEQPVLVSATDGVGTKLRLAIDHNHHDSVGIDLVAMCVNDLIVSGAEPLFFLDYFGTGKLDIDVAESVIKGIAKGCTQASCSLIGGETAELPSLYEGEDYDLAGFCVGIVEKNKMLNPNNVKPSDKLIGLPSSGLHSNGYSLARKILELNNTNVHDDWEKGESLLSELLKPTRIYVKTVLTLLSEHPGHIHGLANITGGGITENLPRVLPNGLKAKVDFESWTWPSIFKWLQTKGNVSTNEMLRTFNCGIGFIMIVDEKRYENITRSLSELKQTFYPLGSVEQHQTNDEPALVEWHNIPS